MNHKKILIATGIYPPDIGGPATMLAAMAKALEAEGFKVSILTYADNKSAGDKNIYRIIRKGRSRLPHLEYFFAILYLAARSDIIYATDTYSVGYFAYLLKKIFGKKYLLRFAGDSAWETAVASGWTSDYITDFQSKTYDHRIEKLKERRKKILANADGVIAVSEFMAGLAAQIGVEKNKIKVIYNSIDFLKDSAEPAPDLKKTLGADAKLIITAGRLTIWKGVAEIIKILPKLSTANNVYFAVLGDGPELENLRQLAKSEGVENRVLFLGRVSNNAVINYFRQADLFILNTNYEGLSHTLLEAMAAGVPIITTAVGGNPEVIENGHNGILVGYNNGEAILSAAEHILFDENFRKTLVSNAKEKLKKFNWQNTVDATAVFINQLI